MSDVEKPVRVFISYAWEGDGYKDWVIRLAKTLRDHCLDVRLDHWDCHARNLQAFMNSEVRNADKVLILGSPEYRRKVHATEDGEAMTGVGWESMLITSAIFYQNSDKMVVAVARGEHAGALPDYLLSYPAHNLTNPDDPGGFLELLKELQGKLPQAPPIGAPPDFPPEVVEPLFQASSSFELTLELRHWIQARWPEGKEDAIYPPWSEFESHRVEFPPSAVESAEANIDIHPCSLIVGRSASGKTVLAAGLAYRWSRLNGRRSFWLDLAEYSQEEAHDLRSEIAHFLELQGANLLVIDNAQSMDKVADWAVTRARVTESGGDNHILFCSRPLQPSYRPQASLEDRLADAKTEIVPDGALFASVAHRLLSRKDLAPAWTPEDFAVWSAGFGGDVIAFGHAVLQGKGRRPSRSMASQYVRAVYIDPARQVPQGLEALERLCALSSLDTIDDAALGGPGFQLLPHLAKAGQVQVIQRGHYRHWKLAHPGLGSLILDTLARDRRRNEDAEQIRILTDIAEASPRYVGLITSRLANPMYGDEKSLALWLDSQRARPGLLESCLSAAPTYVPRVDRVAPDLIPWRRLRDPDFQRQCIGSCPGERPDLVAKFMACALRHEKDAAREMIERLLQDEYFREQLASSPPHLLANFLQYAQGQGQEDAIRGLLPDLLENPDFKKRMASSQPSDLTFFLKYAQEHQPDAIRGLLPDLLENPDFKKRMASTQPHFLANFLQYAQEHQPDAIRGLLPDLLENPDFKKRMASTQPHFLANFLQYAQEHQPDAIRGLLTDLLENPDFKKRMASTQPDQLAFFLKYAQEQEQEDTVKKMLAELMNSEDFAENLAHTPPGDLVAFLRLADEYEKKAVKIFLLELLGNSLFWSNIAGAPWGDSRGFYQYAAARLSAAPHSLLKMMQFNPRLRNLLAYSPPTALAAYFRCALREETDSETEEANLAKLLGDHEFRSALTSTPANLVSDFLSCVESTAPNAVKECLHWLLRSQDFLAWLAGSQAQYVAPFLKYARTHEPAAVAIYLKAWCNARGIDPPADIFTVLDRPPFYAAPDGEPPDETN